MINPVDILWGGVALYALYCSIREGGLLRWFTIIFLCASGLLISSGDEDGIMWGGLMWIFYIPMHLTLSLLFETDRKALEEKNTEPKVNEAIKKNSNINEYLEKETSYYQINDLPDGVMRCSKCGKLANLLGYKKDFYICKKCKSSV